MRGSVIPVGMDRYGNTYFLFPYDFKLPLYENL